MKRWSDRFAFKRRLALFEFHDLVWVPDSIHDDLVYVNNRLHALFKTKDCFIAQLADLVQQTKSSTIIDLCSGAGGIIPTIQDALENDFKLKVNVVLTDLFPPPMVVQRYYGNERIYYQPEPINAGNLPSRLSGMRTLFGSFHHLPPPIAKTVLSDAYQKKQPVFVGELQENNLLQCFGALFTFFLSWLVLATRKPFNLFRFLRATLIPIVPLMYCFDAIASVRRTYTYRDLEEMTRGLSEEYIWKIGKIQVPYFLTPAPYLVGFPLQAQQSAAVDAFRGSL